GPGSYRVVPASSAVPQPAARARRRRLYGEVLFRFLFGIGQRYPQAFQRYLSVDMSVARLHLVDGTYELFRAHFSKRPGHQAADGAEVKATLGFAASMLRLLTDPAERVTHIGVAFDNPI